MDITEKLKIIADLKLGDPWPTEIFGPEFGNWAGALSKICKEAKEEIERLRNTITGIRFGV
jgi:hypothetical protein